MGNIPEYNNSSIFFLFTSHPTLSSDPTPTTKTEGRVALPTIIIPAVLIGIPLLVLLIIAVQSLVKSNQKPQRQNKNHPEPIEAVSGYHLQMNTIHVQPGYRPTLRVDSPTDTKYHRDDQPGGRMAKIYSAIAKL